MNEKSEKKPEPENKVAAKTEGTPKATLGDISGLVPVKQLNECKELLEAALTSSADSRTSNSYRIHRLQASCA